MKAATGSLRLAESRWAKAIHKHQRIDRHVSERGRAMRGRDLGSRKGFLTVATTWRSLRCGGNKLVLDRFDDIYMDAIQALRGGDRQAEFGQSREFRHLSLAQLIESHQCPVGENASIAPCSSDLVANEFDTVP